MDKTLTDALAVAEHYGLSDREVAAAVEAATAVRRAEVERPGMVAMIHQNGGRAVTTLEALEVHQQSGWQLEPEQPAADAEEVTEEPKRRSSRKADKDEEN
jgi:hypothetical protein